MTPLFSPTLEPQLSAGMQAALRAGYGIYLFVLLVITLPHARRFFVSERWGGYAKSSPDVDVLHNPAALPVVLAAWFTFAVMLAAGVGTVWAALGNLLLCRYFFIRMRWRGVLRGMGAPGFMSYWLGAVVFILEYTREYAPHLRTLALFVFQVDFALIMFSAGVYKITAGYLKNDGFELGLVNPEWGYWWKLYRKLSPKHPMIWVLNQLAWVTEVAAAVLMLIPPTRFVGSLLIVFSFAFVGTQIRLGVLCEKVILACFLYFYPGSYGDQLLGRLAPALPIAAGPAGGGFAVFNALLQPALWVYLVMLPPAHAGLFYNFYGRKTLPGPLQKALEIWTNFFGIIIWRVFSVDVVNFCVKVHLQPRAGGGRKLYSRYGITGGFRYCHVGESIAITSLFTTLKYYPSNSSLFQERVLRYARTIPCPEDSVLVFEYVSIRKHPDRFDWAPVAEFIVDPAAGAIEERTIDETVSVRAASRVSPVHEGAVPGSYAPLAR